MIGDYVRWYGQLAKILNESAGYATIKLIKSQTVYGSVMLKELEPIKLQVAKKREKARKLNTFPHWG